ncbi:MAG TPA: phosphoribosylformylglycinamidine cyclo-ligase [Candidatus Atribacteria bacterium]|nr:phosphoribosylformylglycinamidine cyclo-ligase [Candidatus Atribacteria bacterium]
MEERWNYKKAGVDIDLGDKLIQDIKDLVSHTYRPEVISGVGGFSGVFRLGEKWKEPCLVAGSDGVGTKLKIAIDLDKHDTVGIDLVAMCVNDVLCAGAEPIFFLDYLACGKLEAEKFKSIISGIVRGCEEAGCALLGGETAEMPDFYKEGDYDLAGFAVGVVEKDALIDGGKIRKGDVLLGLASSGLHSNGYSLVRKVLQSRGINLSDQINGKILGEELLRPTRIYVRSVLPLFREVEVKGVSHITGGGMIENIPRILPPHLGVKIYKSKIEIPWVFSYIQGLGNIEEEEMWRVFNLGIGLALIVSREEADKASHILEKEGEKVNVIGEVIEGGRKVLLVE